MCPKKGGYFLMFFHTATPLKHGDLNKKKRLKSNKPLREKSTEQKMGSPITTCNETEL